MQLAAPELERIDAVLNAFDKKVVSKNKIKKIRGLWRMCVRTYVGTHVQATLPIQPQTEVKMSQKHQLVLHWLSLLLGILTANQCCKINTLF